MNKGLRYVFITFLAVALGSICLWFFQKNQEVENIGNIEVAQDVQNVEVYEGAEGLEPVQEDKDIKSVKGAVLDAPFVLQAPFANWSDPVFEDACEEAAILMADGWINGKKISSQQAFDGIKEIVKLEKKELGEYVDASAKDTASILKKYSKGESINVFEGISLEKLIFEVSKGNLVIVPTNGRKLGNPNYTAPGPITHMIVIIGYDVGKKQFVTNDSGTRKGKGYRYDESVLFEAIRDYPTGNHYKKPIDESNPEKVMIVVGKNP